MQILKMDFQSQSAPPVVPVMQSDSKSRFIGMALYNGGTPYEAPKNATYTVQYWGRSPNNIGWYDTIRVGDDTHAAVTVDTDSSHIITLELPEQALHVPGDLYVNLCILTETGYELRTFPIICRVNSSYPDGVAAASYFYVVNIKSVQWLAWVTACQEAQDKAELAAKASADSAAEAKEAATAASTSAAAAKKSADKAAASEGNAARSAADAKQYADGVKQTVKDTLQDYTGGYYRTYDLTLPAKKWVVLNPSVGRYEYCCDVPLEGCSSALVPVGTLALNETEHANIATVCQTRDGVIRFYAATPPTADLQVLMTLFAKGTASIVKASDEEADSMLDEIF